MRKPSDRSRAAPQFASFTPTTGELVVDANVPRLLELAVQLGEGHLVRGGALSVETGEHTGRSASDKFIVRDPEHADSIWWEGNQAMEPAAFAKLQQDMLDYVSSMPQLFVQNLAACADPKHQLNVRIITERAWHSLFIQHLLRHPSSAVDPDFVVVNLPGFRADPERHGCKSGTVIAISFTERLALIGGTGYAGETKKSVFSVLNYLLPAAGVMPMHCSANYAPDHPDESAVFFGLSGTGKTTLSAAPDRTLLGDDEHGWASTGLFNFEGGCYAKTIRLSAEQEPDIFRATHRFGTVLENVKTDPITREVDFDDATMTENGRCAYPLAAIEHAAPEAVAGEPRQVLMLACDAFSVLPPIARLSPAQAVYHFLSGFTAKVAGTERGLTGPTPTFSTCFGAPFMVRPPSAYGELFRECLERQQPACWLVNTGWSGGGPGVGERMPLPVTRALLAAALSGQLDSVSMCRDPHFGFEVPTAVPGVDPQLLDPRAGWSDASGYDAEASKLVGMFRENFTQFEDSVTADVRAAAPTSA